MTLAGWQNLQKISSRFNAKSRLTWQITGSSLPRSMHGICKPTFTIKINYPWIGKYSVRPMDMGQGMPPATPKHPRTLDSVKFHRAPFTRMNGSYAYYCKGLATPPRCKTYQTKRKTWFVALTCLYAVWETQILICRYWYSNIDNLRVQFTC